MSGAILRFDADHAKSGAVSRDGAFACIEFAAGEERLWVTVPVDELGKLINLCEELDKLRHDAKNGVASHWLVEGTGLSASPGAVQRDGSGTATVSR